MAGEKKHEPYIQIPKALIDPKKFPELSPEAILLYGLFSDRASLSTKNNWTDEHGQIYFIYSHKAIMADLRCGSNKATALVAALVEKGLVTKRVLGQGNPNHLYIHSVTAPHNRESSTSKTTPQAPQNQEATVPNPPTPDSPKKGNSNPNPSEPESSKPEGGEAPALPSALADIFAQLEGGCGD